MDILKSYLETMFAKMPNTEEIRKAKSELWQMMEDKYNELIEDGKSENEAVGCVISEFGNIDELAAILGVEDDSLSYEPESDEYADRRMLSFEEVKSYLSEKAKHSFHISLGVMLCILSVICPIFTDGLNIPDIIGVSAMMIFIASAVVLFVYSGLIMNKWDFIFKERCMISFESAQYVRDEKNRYRNTYAIRQTVGIILCVVCWIPLMIFDELSIMQKADYAGVIVMFILVAIGVMLIVHTNGINKSYDVLLKLNDMKLISGNYVSEQKQVRYINEKVALVMELYWPTVTAVYLCWSFLTFDWGLTWIIWPVAGILYRILNTNLTLK